MLKASAYITAVSYLYLIIGAFTQNTRMYDTANIVIIVASIVFVLWHTWLEDR